MTIYGPSTALSLAMNLNLWTVVSVMMAACMIYTIFGGMRAVVFADTVQGIQMLISMVFLMIFGTISIGGFSKLWAITSEGERLQFDFSWDLSKTHTVWSTLIGFMTSFAGFYATHQPNIQRLLACASLKQARKINTISLTISSASVLFMTYLGLLAYATFAKCDPKLNKEIKSINQIFPYYVMKTFLEYPGLSGLYFSGLVAASLSTLSSFVNSLACICIDTFIMPNYPNISEKARTHICKFLAFLFGGFTCLAVFFIDFFPNLLQFAVLSVGSVTSPLFALFVVGICCPRVNSKGGIIAFIIGILTSIWISAGLLLFPSSLKHLKPISTEECPVANFTTLDIAYNASEVSIFHLTNNTAENVLNITDSFHKPHLSSTNSLYYMKYAFPFTSPSYLWIGFITFMLTVVLCFIFTYILGKNEVDEQFLEYIPPIIQRFHNCLSPKLKELLFCDVPQIHKNDCMLKEECVPLSEKTLTKQ